MRICREVNLASSSSWMYIAYNFWWLICFHPLLISLFMTKRGRKKKFCFYFNPFVDDWQKRGEVFVISLIYMHVFLLLLLKGEKYLCLCIYVLVLQIGENEFELFYAWVACLSPYICIHVYELSLHIYLFIEMHELRGSFFEASL